MSNDDMLQKLKYYMVLLKPSTVNYLCVSIINCNNVQMEKNLHAPTPLHTVLAEPLECEAAACCHFLRLKPYLE